MVFLAHQANCNIQRLIAQQGEGAAAVHRQGGEHRKQYLLEVLGEVCFLPLVHLLHGKKPDALLFQRRNNGTVQAGVLPLHKAVGLLFQQGEELLGVKSKLLPFCL